MPVACFKVQYRNSPGAKNMKMAVFWNVASHSQVDIDHRFEGDYCLHHQNDWS
jgi:hypothetical protein